MAGDCLQPWLHRPDVYRTTERYIAYVDNLARHGYIVFRLIIAATTGLRGGDRAYGDPGYTMMC